MKKVEKQSSSTADQLKHARQAGLEEMKTTHALCPHGKVAGMDVFSWVNPEVEALNAMIASMSYKVI